MTAVDEERTRKRTKKIALALSALCLVLLAIVLIWWSNLADADIERGPVDPVEGITDSADDPRPKRST